MLRTPVCTITSASTALAVLILILKLLVSGRVLRCEVFVDIIDKIRMQTTTRTVYKDHVEMLSMEATDPEGMHRDLLIQVLASINPKAIILDYLLGNTFNTLRGVEFEWTIKHNSSQSVLQFVPFKGSQMEMTSLLLDMEQEVCFLSKSLLILCIKWYRN